MSKTVTLSSYAAKQLEDYRALNDRYEELIRDEMGDEGAASIHAENDSELIMFAVSKAVDDLRESIAFAEKMKAKRGRTT